MKNSAEAPGALMFRDNPIAIITFEDGGVPYFSLLDLQEALRWPKATVDLVNAPSFPPQCKRRALEYNPEGTEEAVVLSPTGVFYWTNLYDAGKGQQITAWAKREARLLCPDVSPDDPGMYLQLADGGELPPMPLKYSGWRGEWNDLRYSGAAYAKRPSAVSAVLEALAARRAATTSTMP